MRIINAHEFKALLDSNTNAQFIVAGMVGLVDDGFTPREVIEYLRQAEKSTFHSLMEIHRENKED